MKSTEKQSPGTNDVAWSRVWGQNRTAPFSSQLNIRRLDKPGHPQFAICIAVETSIFHFFCSFLHMGTKYLLTALQKFEHQFRLR